MNTPISRRACLGSVSLVAVIPAGLVLGQPGTAPSAGTVPDSFPSQDPLLVRDMVGASHGNIERVKGLLRDAPRLVNATYDWGFGDWETALGAASHVGNRPIAALLLEHGARPDIFTFAMLGNLEAVKAAIGAQPGTQKTRGPHGLTLMHHARAGGEQSVAVLEYLRGVGDADIQYQDLPLTDPQRTVYAGEYSFGPSESQRLTVTMSDKDRSLSIQRSGGVPRRLFHQGAHAFHPAGAPEARITFTVEEDRATAVAITSPSPVVSARRV